MIHLIVPSDITESRSVCLPAVESFIDTDKKYLQNPAGGNRDDGCTAVTAVLVGQKLFVANVGDSRAVLSRGGRGDASFFGQHRRMI